MHKIFQQIQFSLPWLHSVNILVLFLFYDSDSGSLEFNFKFQKNYENYNFCQIFNSLSNIINYFQVYEK